MLQGWVRAEQRWDRCWVSGPESLSYPLLPAGVAASLTCPAPKQCGASPGHGDGAEPGLIPLCTLQEWADVCCRGLRSVHAYILVYDICCFDSFEYIKTIRQQILETR